jgi:hypothetical protein
MAGREDVVYLTDAGTEDTLTRHDVGRCRCRTASEHGAMKMREVASLPIERGKPVMLAFGGLSHHRSDAAVEARWQHERRGRYAQARQRETLTSLNSA